MIVQLPYLLIAIVLLWFPRHWLRVGSFLKRRSKSAAKRAASEPWNTREPGDSRLRFSVEFSKFRNYVDMLRAAAGSLAFIGVRGEFGFPACLTPEYGSAHSSKYAVIAIRSTILLVGLLIQTARREKGKITFYPPVFYLAGLMFGLADPWSALFSFILIWAVNAIFSDAQGFLSVYALFIVSFGHLFAHGTDLSVIFAGVLCFLPVLLSLLAKRPLVVFSRKGTHSTR